METYSAEAQKKLSEKESLLTALENEFPGAGAPYIIITVCDRNKTKEEIAAAIIKSGMNPNWVFAGFVDNIGHRSFYTWEHEFNPRQYQDLEYALGCRIIANAAWEEFWDSSLRDDRTVIEKYRTKSADDTWDIVDVIHFYNKKIPIDYDMLPLK